MKILNVNVKNAGISLMIFCIGVMSVLLTMPKNGYRYNMDAALSPVGMLMIKNYESCIGSDRECIQGYVENGGYVEYKNWPPLSFKVWALWLHLLGDTSLFTARILSALLYGINAMLFFFLLIRNQVSSLVAVISSMIFILLPSHLDFGSLVYADIWFTTFWLLASIVYDHESLKNYWLFSIIIVLGTFFFWFVIFILPMPILVYLINRYQVSRSRVLSYIFVIGLLFLFVLGLIIYTPSGIFILSKVHGYSIYGIWNDFNYRILIILKRLASIGYEAFFIAPLLMIWLPLMIEREKRNQNLLDIMLMMSTALFYFSLVFVNWLAIHRHSVAMFSILLGVIFAILLSDIEKSGTKIKFRSLGVISIIFCLIMFLGLGFVTSDLNDKKNQDDQIITFIRGHHKGAFKPSLFFKVSGEANHFVITDRVNGNPFQMEYYQNLDLREMVDVGFENYRLNDITDFDPCSIFLITEREYKLDDFTVLDYSIINGIYVYHIVI